MRPETVPKVAMISSCRFALLPDPLCEPPVLCVLPNKCGQSSTVAQTLFTTKEVVWNVIFCKTECAFLASSSASICCQEWSKSLMSMGNSTLRKPFTLQKGADFTKLT